MRRTDYLLCIASYASRLRGAHRRGVSEYLGLMLASGVADCRTVCMRGVEHIESADEGKKRKRGKCNTWPLIKGPSTAFQIAPSMRDACQDALVSGTVLRGLSCGRLYKFDNSVDLALLQYVEVSSPEWAIMYQVSDGL